MSTTTAPYHKSAFLAWDTLPDGNLRGYLQSDPGTTLFLFEFTRRGDSPRGNLSGAFIPDANENSHVYQNCLESFAFALAFMTLRDWLEDHGAPILAQLQAPPPSTVDEIQGAHRTRGRTC